jgi:hypothetical protein
VVIHRGGGVGGLRGVPRQGAHLWAESLPASEPTKRSQETANSFRSCVAVRRESGMEEGGNTLDVQAPNEPWELSVVDHSTR